MDLNRESRGPEIAGHIVGTAIGIVVFRLFPFVLIVWALCKYVGCLS